jgi:hypothetical protein
MARRRKSVEWAQWTHDQNQEMLSSMKMEAQGDLASPAPSGGDQEGAGPDKVSKLLSRQGRPSPAPASHSHSHSQAHSLPRHSFHQDHAPAQQGLAEGAHGAGAGGGHDQYHSHDSEETSYLEAEIARLREERDGLRGDQDRLVLIIQSDNAKLMEILNVSIAGSDGYSVVCY